MPQLSISQIRAFGKHKLFYLRLLVSFWSKERNDLLSLSVSVKKMIEEESLKKKIYVKNFSYRDNQRTKLRWKNKIVRKVKEVIK